MYFKSHCNTNIGGKNIPAGTKISGNSVLLFWGEGGGGFGPAKPVRSCLHASVSRLVVALPLQFNYPRFRAKVTFIFRLLQRTHLSLFLQVRSCPLDLVIYHLNSRNPFETSQYRLLTITYIYLATHLAHFP